jgi:hypothetical protein
MRLGDGGEVGVGAALQNVTKRQSRKLAKCYKKATEEACKMSQKGKA